ncbi:hypothetical protein [Humisphaera borealis]|uniref:Uncharacterized protein n=1 Tax=Humisphaera borealis TaxID=2807512 RepID=A0A7M2WUB4_9BACT|nr:hypothetical protein [Humisphaera borealis]QOV89076.1 hypothetical protein IPV69_23110 [Humisphaera borealis]
MPEIKVSWQLGVFITSVFAMPMALVLFYTAYIRDLPVDASTLQIFGLIALGLLVLMVIAVLSRMVQARCELRPDGKPMSAWVARQVGAGLMLCAAGVIIICGFLWFGITQRLAVVGGCLAAGPGIIQIGRALSPVR